MNPSHSFSIGQRVSFDGALCTVRYIGDVEGTKGDWLGVEWDDPFRGKHSGEHKGRRYFSCLSNQPTAASFVRPTRPCDKPLGFLEALHQKYASEFEEEIAKRKAHGNTEDFQMNEAIQFNGKIVEEVGFEKIRKQLAELQELKVVFLEGLRIAGVLASGSHDQPLYDDELQKICQTCPKITELDLTRNLIHRWVDVHDICTQLKKLKTLKLNANRFENVQAGLEFSGVTELHLDQTLMPWNEICSAVAQFPRLESLWASANSLTSMATYLPITLKNLTLENNDFKTISALKPLSQLPNLERLILRDNSLESVFESSSTTTKTMNEESIFQFPLNMKYLDVSQNRIDSWSFINNLSRAFPGLSGLRISGNPLYDRSVGPSSITGLPEKPMTVEEAFMLTLARLEKLTSLNYSKITHQDRTNGELYYLSLIGKELSASSTLEEARIIATHPRYATLCKIHGAPSVKRQSSGIFGTNVKPGSVAARLVNFEFYQKKSSTATLDTTDGSNGRTSQSCLIPRTFDVYRIKNIVSRLFSLPPLKFRLVWETEDWDPVVEFNILGGEEWDSDEDADHEPRNYGREDDRTELPVIKPDGTKLIRREVELVDSIRQVGFWLDDSLSHVRVRIEAM